MEFLPKLDEVEEEPELVEEVPPEPVPIFDDGKKKKRKKPLSEKQLAHLAKMREKAAASNKKHKESLLKVAEEGKPVILREKEIPEESVEERAPTPVPIPVPRPTLVNPNAYVETEEDKVERDYSKFRTYMQSYEMEMKEAKAVREASEKASMLRENTYRAKIQAEERAKINEEARVRLEKVEVDYAKKAEEVMTNQRNPVQENWASDHWF